LTVSAAPAVAVDELAAVREAPVDTAAVSRVDGLLMDGLAERIVELEKPVEAAVPTTVGWAMLEVMLLVAAVADPEADADADADAELDAEVLEADELDPDTLTALPPLIPN